MDDLEAPSFSLGLDEEIHEGSASHAVAPPLNPFRISARNGNGTVSKAADIISLNGTGNTDYDSDFELPPPPPSSTERIMKRLKRKSGQSFSAPSNAQQQVHDANCISKANAMGSQNLCKGLDENKRNLATKTPTRKTLESNVQTLQKFWGGLTGKPALNLPAYSGCKNFNESKSGCTGQGSGRPMKSMPVDPSARTSGSQTGASLVCEGTTSDFNSGHHSLASKAGLCQGYAESSCSEKEGLLAQRPNGKKEDLLGKWGMCEGDTLQSFESCIDVEIHEELPIRNPEQSRDTTLESPGNSTHNQKAGCHQGASTNGRGMAQTFQRNLDENCDFLDDFSFANTREKTEAPMQTSWRSLDAKTRNLSDDFSTRCASQTRGKSAEGPKMTPKDQLLDSDLGCPANANQIKKNAIDTSLTKTNALHSFWKSLNEKNSSPLETDIGAEDDDIENCSSDNDFEIGTQSARKLSLCGNATTRKTFGLGNPAAGNPAADHTFGRSSAYPHSIETSANARANNSLASPYPPNKIMADARPTPRLASCSTSDTFSASPRTYQSFVVGDALRVSPVHNLDKFQTKQSSFSEKREATLKNISWPCIDDNNDDAFFLPRALNEDRAFDDYGTPTHASKAKASPFGGNSSCLVNPILSNDSRVASLLQIRFPHFRSITALSKGDFIGSEQVYIDYGDQFSGGKATSCQSGPRVFKQEARQFAPRSSTKWRQASQKKQKIAMADNDGWIQTGNRNPSRNRAMKSKKGRKGSQESPQTPVNTDFNSSVGAGHWVTERSGKRIYVTKDGRKLSGSSAYKQHMKDSGKRFKKTKRRRPRK